VSQGGSADKMPLIPRTPLSPGRTISKINGGITIRPLILEDNENVSPSALMNRTILTDAYDRFAQRFFLADTRLQQMLIEHIIHLVPHPVYRHLLQTMTRENAVHVMGYLRSQHDTRLYEVLMGLISV
jgi:hypothetical protein